MENGISRFSGLWLRTILPSGSFVSSCGICSRKTISLHGRRQKAFRTSLSEHGVVLRNFVHFELVGGHLAESIAQRFNPLQQFLAAGARDIQTESRLRKSWRKRSPKHRV